MGQDMTEQTNELPTEVDINMIQKLIPHRYPFLFLDKVRDIVPFEKAVGVKNITFNEPHFQGHFPSFPIMPGVAQVEAMAQTSGVLAALSLNAIEDDILVYFMTIDKCKFRRKVVPGDVMELHVEVQRRRSKMWRMHGTALVDGEVACEAEFAAMFERQE